MALSKQELVSLYRRRAKRYNLSSYVYYLIGFRYQAYRKMAVHSLGLKKGDTVVDIACGTGMNFPLLEKAVGPKGKIIGVDATDAMLDEAIERVAIAGWHNVDLIHCDAANYTFPDRIDGVLSTLAITLIPEFDEIIRKGSMALSSGGRFAVLDFKVPDDKSSWLINLLVYLTSPFGVSLDMGDRHPWESVERYFTNSSFTSLYGGFAYLSVGEAV